MWGVMYYAALVPCVFSSLIASKVAGHMGIGPNVFHLSDIPDFHLIPSIQIILLAMLCAGLSVLFCIILHSLGDFYRSKLKNPYIRIVCSSLVIILLTILLHTSDYMGAGVPVIARAIEGTVRPDAFFWKIIFTALTLEAGFKGGEIVPSFFVGATFWLFVWTAAGTVSFPVCRCRNGFCVLRRYQLSYLIAADCL